MNDVKSPVLYSTLLVEDDPAFIEQLSQYISQVNFLSHPIICHTGVDALKVMATPHIDILFLDLTLPDMSGLDLLRASRNTSAVIVTSAYSELAIDCYDFDIIDFLPKPYDFNRFLRGVGRVLERIQTTRANEVKPAPAPDKEEIYLKSGRRLERFAYNDILYIEAYGLYIKVHTLDGVFAINKRISVLSEDLPNDRFIRIHKSYIVNVSHLKRLESKAVWIKTTKIPIGITYQPTVHEHLQKLGISAKTS
ncbi:LytR/AlgR family response regulator transcription factor [Spirosoma fluviale]|uniref:Two component transcriptional regulator, LytTR family n=1 Tax=Spirosoma fluviale TaxID=1597977 RepID=A0A286G8E6_9BACT|nr:LytTR family DNA-binding domain-containing protein [Spirosoma fluviale]SOD91847.1 two component transcriptional regulator, LytTR family [Spirosoma fluviale]